MLRRTAPGDVTFAVDVVIAFALCLSVTFFLVVMECRLTRGELTRAQLALMRPAALAGHSGHVKTRTR
jgi:hypothetical protein